MKSRRDFMKLTGMTSLGLAGGLPTLFGRPLTNNSNPVEYVAAKANSVTDAKNSSLIGAYGKWAAGLNENKLPSLSFRNKEFTNVDTWKKRARKQLTDRLAIPDLGILPVVTVKKQYSFDGL